MSDKLKSVDIKGKKYVEVHERIRHFRTAKEYENWCLVTEILEHNHPLIIIKANIYDDKDRLRATGIAYEKEGNSFINKTSYIENCETSAWGRALGNLGIGVDTSIASADEVGNAIEQQEQPMQHKPSGTPNGDKQKTNGNIRPTIDKSNIDWLRKYAIDIIMVSVDDDKDKAAKTLSGYGYPTRKDIKTIDQAQNLINSLRVEVWNQDYDFDKFIATGELYKLDDLPF